MRVALVHDWLTGMRGGEKVLQALGDIFPSADLFTLLHAKGSCQELVRNRRVVTSFLDALPGVARYYRYLLPLMPLAAERLDLRGYDVIVSSSHCVAKGVKVPSDALHICYCHTPMRYLWSQSGQYARRLGWLSRTAMAAFRRYLQDWDVRSAARVDLFLANSHNVARRIERVYGRPSTVVWPGVDTEYFCPGPQPREDFYLVLSALAPYKCVDQAVEAFGRLQRPLRVIGSGQMLKALRRSSPSNIQWLGWQSQESVREHLRRCRALIFPTEEDFGIVPVEAMACGTPVIAYQGGGALETVLDAPTDDGCGPTGLLYPSHDAQGLIGAVERFEQTSSVFRPERLVAWADRFSMKRFRQRFVAAIEPELERRNIKGLC
ncbi:MAG: glycosyltransferase [Planctomycetaceae bacterium]|nr:glycosyltransferase [Planctomycetaceae bacterium]